MPSKCLDKFANKAIEKHILKVTPEMVEFVVLYPVNFCNIECYKIIIKSDINGDFLYEEAHGRTPFAAAEVGCEFTNYHKNDIIGIQNGDNRYSTFVVNQASTKFSFQKATESNKLESFALSSRDIHSSFKNSTNPIETFRGIMDF